MPDNKQNDTRHKGLGKFGQQPTVEVNCILTKAQQEVVEGGIIRQKYGCTSKQQDIVTKHVVQNPNWTLLLVKRARIDMRS